MEVIRHKFKRLGIDVLGVLLVLSSGLLGWLPGPGGIPLLIAGLGLLAVNHEWAKRWLESVRSNGFTIFDRVINHSRLTQWAVDIAALLLLILLAQSIRVNHGFVRSISISLVITTTIILLANRHRYRWLKQHLLRRKP
jgi:branched-subunit amino acid transport protein AzlD